MRDERLGFYIDGTPLVVADWSASASWLGGWATADLLAWPSSTARSKAVQEAPLDVYRSDGSLFWSGPLALDGDVDDDGLHLSADGPVRNVAAVRQRLFYLSADTSIFVPSENDPFDFPSNKNIAVDATPGALRFKREAATFALSDLTGLAAWVPGDVITAVEATLRKSATFGSTELRWRSFTGPQGALTLVAQTDLGAANPDGTVLTITGFGEDGAEVSMRQTAAATPTAIDRAWLTNVAVRGRATGRVFSLAQVFADAFSVDGLESVVDPTGLANVMPLDWTEAHPALYEYLCRLGDWSWTIGAKDSAGRYVAHAGPWSDRITVDLAAGGRSDLAPLPRYSAASVSFERTNGTSDQVTVAAPANPLASGASRVADSDVHGVTLEGQQLDSGLATDVATTLAARYAEARYQGTVDVYEALDANESPIGPFDVFPGKVLTLRGHDPDVAAQRIYGVAWSKAGPARCDVGQEVNASTLIARAAAARKRG